MNEINAAQRLRVAAADKVGVASLNGVNEQQLLFQHCIWSLTSSLEHPLVTNG